MESLHERGENGIRQTEAHHGQRALNQLLGQNKSRMTVRCCSLSTCQSKTSWRMLGTDRGNNIYPIYILLGKRPTGT